jgi:hypothetical protein
MSEVERGKMARSIMLALDAWHIGTADQLHLLGLTASSDPRTLMHWRSGVALPEEGDVLQRAQGLLAIQHALETTFPHNTAVVAYWMTTENPHFGRQTPLAALLAGGLPVIEAMRDHLDGVSSWC